MEADIFLRDRRLHCRVPSFYNELGREQLLLLSKDAFLRGTGLHFTLSLKVMAMLRDVRVIRVIHGVSWGVGWGRGCCIANFL